MKNRDDWAVGVILSASVHPASGGHIGPPLQCVGRVEGGGGKSLAGGFLSERRWPEVAEMHYFCKTDDANVWIFYSMTYFRI